MAQKGDIVQCRSRDTGLKNQKAEVTGTLTQDLWVKHLVTHTAYKIPMKQCTIVEVAGNAAPPEDADAQGASATGAQAAAGGGGAGAAGAGAKEVAAADAKEVAAAGAEGASAAGAPAAAGGGWAHDGSADDDAQML